MKSDSRRSGGLSVLDQLQRSTSKLGAVELEQSHELREFGDDTGARISGGIQSGNSATYSTNDSRLKPREGQAPPTAATGRRNAQNQARKFSRAKWRSGDEPYMFTP